jgi:hypothetical protein
MFVKLRRGWLGGATAGKHGGCFFNSLSSAALCTASSLARRRPDFSRELHQPELRRHCRRLLDGWLRGTINQPPNTTTTHQRPHQYRTFLAAASNKATIHIDTLIPSHHTRQQDAGLRLLKPQPQPCPSRPRCSSSQGYIHRYYHRRRPLRWRCCHCCRYSCYQRPHSRRQGTHLGLVQASARAFTNTMHRTVRSSTTSRLRSGVLVPVPQQTPNSPPRSWPQTSNFTPSPPAASHALSPS